MSSDTMLAYMHTIAVHALCNDATCRKYLQEQPYEFQSSQMLIERKTGG